MPMADITTPLTGVLREAGRRASTALSALRLPSSMSGLVQGPTPAAAKKAQETPPKPDLKAHGITGTQLSGGYVWSDTANQELVGQDWVDAADEMMRDPVIYAAWVAQRGTLKSATFQFEAQPGGSQEPADYLNEAFGFGQPGRMSVSFEQQLDWLLRYLLLGWRYSEEIYYINDGRVWLDRYADREPSAHAEWVPAPDGTLAAVRQWGTSAVGLNKSTTLDIPANKILHLVVDATGSGLEGTGQLRPCYQWRRLKRHTLDMLGIGVERWAVPTPMATFDYPRLEEQAKFSRVDIDTIITRVKATLKNYVSHQLGYIMKELGVDIEAYGANTLDVSGPIAVIRLCDQQILMASLLQFLTLGTNDTGSRAVGSVLETFYRRASINHLDYLVSRIGGRAGPGQGTAGRLLAWNFKNLKPVDIPIMRHEGLDARAGLNDMANIAQAIKSGALTPDDQIERFLRRSGRMPDLDQAHERSTDQRLAGSQGGLAALVRGSSE